MNTNLRKLLSVLLVVCSTFSASTQDTIAFFNFDDDAITTWTIGATGIKGDTDGRCSWEIGTPSGGQGYNNFFFQWRYEGNPDPISDHSLTNSINKVAGQGLGASSTEQGVSGYFVNSSEWIQSPVINCENIYNVSLSFWRWANFEPNSDYAFVEVSNDGATWFALEHPMGIEDSEWTQIIIDISEYADWKQQVYLRWRSESSAWTYYSGWNIDDVLITGNSTTNNHDSKITEGTITAPKTISSLIDSYEERIDICDFSISDMGAGDNLPTIIDTLVITTGSSHTVESLKNAIDGAFLYSSSFTSKVNNEIAGIVKKNKIYFIGENLISIADGSSELFVFRLNLKKDLSAISDNDQFEFEINFSNQKLNSAGSFINSGNLYTGNNLLLDISATELRFISEPEPLQAISRDMLPAAVVAATDENGNIDIDFVASVSVNSSTGLTMKNKKEAAISGIATFATLQFTELGGPTNLVTTHKGDRSITNATSSVQVTILDNIENGFFFNNFDDSGLTGWTTGANGVNGESNDRTSWKLGNPNAGEGFIDLGLFIWNVGNPDPSRDVSRNSTNNVYGQGLGSSSQTEGVSSYFSNSEEWLMSPVIDCRNYHNIQFSFYRWANFEADSDSAFVEISTDGTTWSKLDHPLFPEDNSWTKISYDISEIADRQESVYLRWRSVSNRDANYAGWNIDDVELNGIFSPITDWTGEVSSDWNDVNNWSGSVLPDQLSNVTVAADAKNFPVISSGNAACNQLTISANANLTIKSGGTLSVYGDLIIETTSSTYGSLIDYGNLTIYGKGRMSRYIANRKWQYVSSPFAETNASIFGIDVYRYDEVLASDDWFNGWVQVTDLMQPGIGYDVLMTTNTNVPMEGQFNTGEYSVNVSNTDGVEVAEHEGWNLVGNPYPSAIDWDAASGWTKSNIKNAIYIWDKDLQNYVTYISGVGVNGGTNYIAPMQGFFIKALNPGTGTITMNNEVRVANTQSQLKSTGSAAEGLNIRLSSETYSDEAVLRFLNNASMNYDNGLDAEKKFSTNENVPQIYTKTASNETLAINTIGNSEEYIQIPIFINISMKGEYLLEFDGAFNLDYSKTVYLEDMLTGEFVNLYEVDEYTFNSERVTDNARFILHVGMPLQINYEVTHVSSIGGSDGQIDMTVMGGNLPIGEIVWSDGSITEDLQNIQAGTYTVIVTDANDESVSESIVVMQPNENGELTGISENASANNELKIYSFDNTVYLESTNEISEIKNITIYDLSGKIIYSDGRAHFGKVSITLAQFSGLFIIKANHLNKNITNKVILK